MKRQVMIEQLLLRKIRVERCNSDDLILDALENRRDDLYLSCSMEIARLLNVVDAGISRRAWIGMGLTLTKPVRRAA